MSIPMTLQVFTTWKTEAFLKDACRSGHNIHTGLLKKYVWFNSDKRDEKWFACVGQLFWYPTHPQAWAVWSVWRGSRANVYRRPCASYSSPIKKFELMLLTRAPHISQEIFVTSLVGRISQKEFEISENKRYTFSVAYVQREIGMLKCRLFQTVKWPRPPWSRIITALPSILPANKKPAGPRFTNCFSIAIRIRWKFRFTLTSILMQ